MGSQGDRIVYHSLFGALPRRSGEKTCQALVRVKVN